MRRRGDEKFDVDLGADLLELAHELETAVELDGFDFEGSFSMRSRRSRFAVELAALEKTLA